MKAALRETDFAVRWGGEEFLIVLQGCSQAEALIVADKLRQAVEQATPCPSDLSIKTTISIGISEFDGKESPEHAVNRADGALYSAKSGGRNRICLSS
jgi:diguanylate cyclase (GGDEF)-like protein